MVMFIKGNGLMIKHKEKVFTYIKMELPIQGSGLTISNMVMVFKGGLMVLLIKETSEMV